MNFGSAIEALKSGLKVARSGWNGKGMFLYYVPANSYPAQTEAAKAFFFGKKEGGNLGGPIMVPYRAYIAMKTVDDDVVPWLASQTDMLADDWEIID
jgi:hypothetical protein